MRRLVAIFLVAMALGMWSHAQTQYYGAIDLGSKGTKAALFSFDKGPEGPEARVLHGRAINTKLVSSMKDGLFTDEGIQSATDAAKELMSEMEAEAKKSKLTKIEYFIVGSSGVAKGKNKDALAASVKSATGIDMAFIDAKKEGYFGLTSSIPVSRRGTSLYVDVGSGNTKLGCMVGGSDLASFRSAEIQYGSVSGRNRGSEKNGSDIKTGIEQVMTEEVKPGYEKASMDTPCLRNRDRIYWTGGAAWATSVFMHPEKSLNGYVVITKRDLDTFLARLGDGSWNQKRFQYQFPKDMPEARQAEIQKKAEKDRQDVLNVFVREDLLSGVSIMKTVLESSNPSATLHFVRDGGNFLYGYALEKYQGEMVSEGPAPKRKRAQ